MEETGRKFTFDSGHRVMNERFKCFNIHGHTYTAELNLTGERNGLGYSIDFKEVKRLFGGWIDEKLDHKMIVNPADDRIIHACADVNSGLYIMSVDGEDYTNPTVENIALELYMTAAYLFSEQNIRVESLKLWETVNCYCVIRGEIPSEKQQNFLEFMQPVLEEFIFSKGAYVEYDDRK